MEIIITIDMRRAGMKFIFNFKRKGNEINKESEGITNQKILIDKSEIFWMSFVSKYNQIKAITETSGIEANIPPQNELLFEISEITTIKLADIKTFRM